MRKVHVENNLLRKLASGADDTTAVCGEVYCETTTSSSYIDSRNIFSIICTKYKQIINWHCLYDSLDQNQVFGPDPDCLLAEFQTYR